MSGAEAGPEDRDDRVGEAGQIRPPDLQDIPDSIVDVPGRIPLSGSALKLTGFHARFPLDA
ncbi:MAG: hypothetical protein ACE5HK_07330, partial [Candidatus Methylomirabilales bacterium]